MSQKDFDVVHHTCTTEILRISAFIVVACQLRNFHLEQHIYNGVYLHVLSLVVNKLWCFNCR